MLGLVEEKTNSICFYFQMQRVCFCKTVSLFNHVLQPSQALALFYQSLLFSLKNLALIRWISSTIDIPTGLQLLMIDINGNVTIDDDLIYKQLANTKRTHARLFALCLLNFCLFLDEVGQQLDTTSVRKSRKQFVCIDDE